LIRRGFLLLPLILSIYLILSVLNGEIWLKGMTLTNEHDGFRYWACMILLSLLDLWLCKEVLRDIRKEKG